jgi:hypothetical protein
MGARIMLMYGVVEYLPTESLYKGRNSVAVEMHQEFNTKPLLLSHPDKHHLNCNRIARSTK